MTQKNDKPLSETTAAGTQPKLNLALLSQVDNAQAAKQAGHELSTNDVHKILSDAHAEDEEVETEAFGLETDEGDIVKVYVNIKDSDGFEKALADMLGSEDDIETALEKLSTRFDIVDVEWPDMEEEEEGEEDKEEDCEDCEGCEKCETEDEAEAELELSPEDLEKAAEAEEEEEEIKQEESKMSSFGQKFTQRLLSAINQEITSDSSLTEAVDKKEMLFDLTVDQKELERKFQIPMQRKIIQTILLMGFPVSQLKTKLSSLRDGVEAAQETLTSNPQALRYFKELHKVLGQMVGAKQSEKAEVMEGEKDAHFSSIYQQKIYDLYKMLGVPEELLGQQKKTRFIEQLKDMAILVMSSPELRRVVNNLEKALGKEDAAIGMKSTDRPVGEKIMAEEMMASDALGTSPLAQVLVNLFNALELGDAINKQDVLQKLKKQIRDDRMEVKGMSMIVNKLNSAVEIINKGKAKPAEGAEE